MFRFALLALSTCTLVFSASCGDSYDDQTVEPGASPIAATATIPPAIQTISARDESLQEVADAVLSGDASAVLKLVSWHQEICGVRRDVGCGTAIEGEVIDVVNAGWPGDFYVPAEVLHPSLEQALHGQPLDLIFAAQSKEQPTIYLLGFESTEVKGKGLAPLADPTSNMTGLFFLVDTSLNTPIIQIEQLSDEYGATKRGSHDGVDGLNLIIADDVPN
jgi:hypothetical protein